MKSIYYILAAAAILYYYWTNAKEAFGGTSPATLMQLSASSGYYPFWRYGYGYRWPYYRYVYPYRDCSAKPDGWFDPY